MHHELIAYLLGGLESEELARVSACLDASSELRDQLQTLRRGLEPLEADLGNYDPPPGLALRTCCYLQVRVYNPAEDSG